MSGDSDSLQIFYTSLIGLAIALPVLTIIGLIIFKLVIKLSTGWCRSPVCLVGKTAIITGANTGIGYETALDLAKRGARVILACRNEVKATAAKEKIIAETDNPNIIVKLVDMSSFKSVRSFVADVLETEDRLDLLINNAGLGGVGDAQTEDGLLQVMQVNYYSQFLLTVLLLDLLKKTGKSRVINVSSALAKIVRVNVETLNDKMGGFLLYSKSKLCNILFTIELNARLKGTQVTTYSLHPGLVQSDFFRNMNSVKKFFLLIFVRLFYKTAEEGAQTTIYTAVQKNLEEFSGEHFDECQVVGRYCSASSLEKAQELWRKTEDIVHLSDEEKQQLLCL